MPKTLLIMRHAKSSWSDANTPDRERPLTARGKREAELMAAELVRRGLGPDQVLCSTARRARSTAKRVVAQPGIPAEWAEDARLYESTPHQCLRVLATQGSGDTVLLIAHNPTLEELVHALTLRYISLSTSTVAVVRLPLQDWRELNVDSQGRLEAIITPRDVAGGLGKRLTDDGAEPESGDEA